MRLLLLRDKKPGHFHQVEGIAMALDRAVGAEVRRIDIRPKWFAHDDVRKILPAPLRARQSGGLAGTSLRHHAR